AGDLSPGLAAVRPIHDDARVARRAGDAEPVGRDHPRYEAGRSDLLRRASLEVLDVGGAHELPAGLPVLAREHDPFPVREEARPPMQHASPGKPARLARAPRAEPERVA